MSRKLGDKSRPDGVGVFQFAFPDGENVPAELPKSGFVIPVAFNVPREFFRPIGAVALGGGGVFAVRMAVPEAAMDEDDAMVFGQNDVRLSRQGFVFRTVYGKAISEGVEDAARDQFWLRVTSFHSTH